MRRYALQNAIRLALAGSIAFALTLGLLDDIHAATFAIFGCFALVLFSDFSGSPGVRLRAYLLLALTGVPLIVVGTLCSETPWLATVAMALVGFTILFSGIFGGTFAAGSTGALLAFVLAATIPAPADALDERLLGWAIATALSVPAALLLWPRRPRDRLRAAAAAGCRAFADLAQSHCDGEVEQLDARREAAAEAVRETRTAFYATPYRPAGATGPAAALAALADDLDWLGQFAARLLPQRDDETFPRESAELHAAVAALLDSAAERLEGGSGEPDFARLSAARERFGGALLQSIEQAPRGEEERIERELEHAFALRMMSYAAWHLAADALRACGETVPEIDANEAAGDATATAALRRRGTRDAQHAAASGRLAAAYASTRSIWFRNSVRGGLGLALAVGIGNAAELQHAFWVVLGTVSVLRSRALSTGASAVQALAGTLIGIVAGGLVVLAVGGNEAVLWALLPLTLLLAASAPRAISFVAGQAAFSLAVLVIFNLIEPVGWSVGLVRIEDIAIGCAISLAVGLLLWPRGATAVLRRSLAAAYASSAAVLA
ncbi:MAG TPA: FUSC family protein, partial [Conexibacter sp.]|nr:FUSC family protein [Conexibacter sp.]